MGEGQKIMEYVQGKEEKKEKGKGEYGNLDHF